MPQRDFLEIKARDKLRPIGQEHLLDFWAELNPREKESLLSSIEELNLDLFHKQRQQIATLPPPPRFFTPYTHVQEPKEEYKKRGRELLAKGKCAAIVLAGGSGSRLNFHEPKGCFPITLIKKKSLYQRMGERVLAASHQNQFPLEIAFMTSPNNHLVTETFFAKHAFFNLSASQVHFFKQPLWPLLSLSGDLFLESREKIAKGPNGNGVVLERLKSSGLLKQWQEKGIEIISLIPIDNALADPFDPELIGFHSLADSDFSLRVALRKNPLEKVGVLVDRGDSPAVIEYTELSEEAREEKAPFFANLNLYCINLQFLENRAFDLPIHRVKKAAKKAGKNGAEEVEAWKFEYFLFDYLSFAKKTGFLASLREECFAPLKNFEGEDSILTVQEAIQKAERKLFFQLSNKEPPVGAVFELASEFYYPTPMMQEYWKDRPLPNAPYIEKL